eukprot:1875572-Amphidinium_carterae.1
MPAGDQRHQPGVNIVWMTAHQSDCESLMLKSVVCNSLTCEGTVWLLLLPTIVLVLKVPFEPCEEWKHWGIVCQAVRHFCPEHRPRVRLPAPEPTPVEVVPVMEITLLGSGVLAAPFVVGRINVLLSMRPTPFAWIATDVLGCTQAGKT